MKLIQHVDLEPGWPELGHRADDGDSLIPLAQVEDLLPAGEQRANVYFLLPKDGRTKVWPWKEAGYYVDDHGKPMAPVGPMPSPGMSAAELASLGLDDAKLWAEHAAYYREPLVQPHPHAEDTPEAQALRRRVYDEVTAAWYSDPPMPRLHPGT